MQLNGGAPIGGAPIVVTGATGFIGRHLVARLVRAGCQVLALSRGSATDGDLPQAPNLHWRSAPHAGASIEEWTPIVTGALAVLHLAGLAHRPLESDANDRAQRRAAWRDLRRVNVLAAHRLATAAAAAGVRDFLFVSSIKAVGEQSGARALDELAPPSPQDCYGWAKYAAERHLDRLAKTTAMRICVLRPPLVYGRGVKGNFARLQHLVERGLPMPLASVDNRRSLLHVDNLTDAMMRILARPEVPGGCFHLCDPKPLSTPELFAAIAYARRKPARLFRFPVSWLRLAGRLSSRQAQVERLTGSLVIDDTRFRRDFGWVAPRTTPEALAQDGGR